MKHIVMMLPETIPFEKVSELAKEYQVKVSLDDNRLLSMSGDNNNIDDAMEKLSALLKGES